MPQGQPTKRHLRVDHYHRDGDYKSKRRPTGQKVPVRANAKSHGEGLLRDFKSIADDYSALAQSWEGKEDIKSKGILIELESIPGIDIDLERLEKNGWELLNERVNSQLVTLQTWFVPDGKLGVLTSIIETYLSKTSARKGKVQPKYRSLIESIERVGKAAAQQLWTERGEDFPSQSVLWFEVWLRGGNSEAERADILEQFKNLSQDVGLRVGNAAIKLPEHTIIAVYGQGDSFSRDLALLNCVAEIRRGRDYADYFDSLRPEEQTIWLKALLERMEPGAPGAPYVSVLDTGINRAHPLLERLIPTADNLTINPNWSAADDDQHGTMMAGLCLFGDLTTVLSGTEKIQLPVNLEGVKIVPPPGERGGDEKLAGAYTAQGVALAEANTPMRRRVWCVATTMKGPNDPVPTSWSSQMDALTSGFDNDGQLHRLVCVSAGNIPQSDWIDYPRSNYGYSLENPGQSWNTLCVGAFTELCVVRQTDSYNPLAARGALCPASSTSLSWDNRWPNKPDVVFEGGNAGHQPANNSTLQLPELLLLSTHADFNNGAFGVMCGTSPATALAARFAGEIMMNYPELSPESVRGLIVHSAEWTPAMEAAVETEGFRNKRDKANFLLRTVGYGVPSLRRALECANARATLIAECEIQPFKIEGDKISFNHMHVHELPWPTQELNKISQEKVRMRVTLSYFVEPNPGTRGTSHFRYPSCSLRFKVSSPGQTADDLAAEVSKLAAEAFQKENSTHVKGTTDGWLLGQACSRGSIHSDVWEGTAADLLSMRHVVVFPVTGWWRTRPSHKKAESQLKYSLIVTLEAESQQIDIYTEIANQITVPVPIETR